MLDDRFEALGRERKTALIIPDLQRKRLPLLIGLSGRIAAGKTTAARWIERMGFAYTRFSLVIDDEISALSLTHNRATRQQIGIKIHDERGQAWLCNKAIARVGDAQAIVVDGLRWPEDHAYFVEHFGTRFVHCHIKASSNMRFDRVASDVGDRAAFNAIDLQPVEAMIDTLGLLAAIEIENGGTLEQFEAEIGCMMISLVSEVQR